MIVKTVDVGLMANHLSAHKAIIKRLEIYVEHAQNQQITTILEKQILMMKNHVQAMNQLLNPKQNNASLPPIPNGVGMSHNKVPNNLGVSDQDIAVDAHFTASAMAKENFNSSENMRNQQVKKLHSEMALQQSTIAGMYEHLMDQMGWMNQPNASVSEQTAAITPLNAMQNKMMNENQPMSNSNHIN
ncbi:hypothetical protein [Virgibacillus oceani]|uniref:Spore coat protein n=1 Tax=Virgibacillus oceani TaxID=1479511 RepID=A0A917LVV2_9BACI|nr:hypothetical protein [Virgibacillus oceani]GGG61104.1 hypothetical protein GCM10011398_00450 [Virgibacillus oceani]